MRWGPYHALSLEREESRLTAEASCDRETAKAWVTADGCLVTSGGAGLARPQNTAVKLATDSQTHHRCDGQASSLHLPLRWAFSLNYRRVGIRAG